GVQGPELDLYRGLLLLELSDTPRDAALALERARGEGGDALEPMASYYAGVAWARASERERARESLERVVAAFPGADWARPAQAALAGLEARRPYWASLRAGYEYDDNVVLLGNGVALPSEISSQRDDRAVWLLQAGGEIFRGGPWAAGAAASYEGWAHSDLSEFDLHYPSLQLWLDRRLGERTTVRALLDGDYAWVDGEPFYTSHGAGLALFESFGRAGTTELGARLWAQNYLFAKTDVPDGPGTPGAPCFDDDPICGPAGLDESRARNRDGTGFTLGLLHTVPLAAERAQLRFGFRYYHFGARGQEYSYNAYEWLADLNVRLPGGFALPLRGGWDHPPNPRPAPPPPPPPSPPPWEPGARSPQRTRRASRRPDGAPSRAASTRAASASTAEIPRGRASTYRVRRAPAPPENLGFAGRGPCDVPGSGCMGPIAPNPNGSGSPGGSSGLTVIERPPRPG